MKIFGRFDFAIITEYEYIVIYNNRRKMWRIYTSTSRSNWNKNLKYCVKSLKNTEDIYVIRSIHNYKYSYKIRTFSTYQMFYMNESEFKDIRTFKDFEIKFAEVFI